MPPAWEQFHREEWLRACAATDPKDSVGVDRLRYRYRAGDDHFIADA